MSFPKKNCRRSRSAFTLVELLIVIGIIVVLIAIIMPATQMVRQTQRASACAHNLTQIGKAFLRATKAGNDQLSVADAHWFNHLEKYLEEDARIFHCVEHLGSGVGETTVSYGINNRADLLRSGDKIVMLDYERTLAKLVGPPVPEGTNWREIYDDWPSLNAPRHRGRMNVLFRDGRVESKGPDEINPVNCFLYTRYWRPARATGFNRQCINELGVEVTDEIELPDIEDPPTDGTDGVGGDTGGDTGADEDDDEFEKPVDEGLIWLIRHQMGNGGWSLKHWMGGTPACAGRCSGETTRGPMTSIATAFALLVFLGNGENGPGSGDYKDVVAKGVNYLMTRVQTNGRIQDDPDHSEGYVRGFTVMALVEALRKGSTQGSWGVVDSNALRAKTELAVNYMANCETAGGGFRYFCGGSADTSVTAMMTQGVKSAEEARINVPNLDGILARLHVWLDKVQVPASVVQDGQFAGTPFYNLGSIYGYASNSPGSDAMRIAGGYIRLYVNPELKYHDAMENLARWLDDKRKTNGIPADRYFNFYAHHFMREMGDGTIHDRPSAWSDWKGDMKSMLEGSRKKDGHERGSWDPVGGGRNTELGRLGVTCLSLLDLEDYYKNIKLTDG